MGMNGEPVNDDAASPKQADDDGAAAARANAAQRFEQQTLWVDAQIRQATARGDFDNLPGAGKPIEGISDTHDPEWWVKRLIEREQITGLGPPAILLRKEDAELDTRLDGISAEKEVRRILEDFNARVVSARRQLLGGPPVVTATREVDAEVEAWRTRREERLRALRAANKEALQSTDSAPADRPRRWWQRRRN
jgi:DnaJ homologue, subfamily C, member 28, conserved domain